MSPGAPKPTRPPGAKVAVKVAAKAEPCPICRKPAVPDFVPFCSPRCADIDLGRWLTDRYAIPTAEDEDEDAEAPGGVPAGRARTPD